MPSNPALRASETTPKRCEKHQMDFMQRRDGTWGCQMCSYDAATSAPRAPEETPPESDEYKALVSKELSYIMENFPHMNMSHQLRRAKLSELELTARRLPCSPQRTRRQRRSCNGH